MGEVLHSDASEAFAEFMVRHFALGDLAPDSEDVVIDGVEASPDGGDAMARAHLQSLPEGGARATAGAGRHGDRPPPPRRRHQL